jgi:thiol-disulfide isomerase/thioredoxin
MFEEGFSFSGYERDPLYLNLGTRKFLEVSGVSGIDSVSDGRAAVFADFDNDGDLDVFLTTLQGASHLLFRNNVGQAGDYVRVSLEGSSGLGRDAYGAVVRLRTSSGVLTKIKAGGSGYISQHDPRLLFGLGSDASIESIEVTWPNGRRERFEGPVKAGSSVLLRERTGQVVVEELRTATLPDPRTKAERLGQALRVAVGKRLPELPLKTLEGRAVSSGDLVGAGRRLLVNLWATWCGPCVREMPELEALRPRLAARGIDVVGLNVDTEVGADIGAFVKKTGVRYPTYVGGVAAVERLYATDEVQVPVSFLVDEKGIVTELIPGWSEESRRRFAALAGPPAEAPPSPPLSRKGER